MSETRDRAGILLSGAFWNLLARVFNILLSLVAIRLLVHARGDGEYGLLVLSFNLLGYFSLAGMGMPAGTVKYIAELNARRDVEEQSRVASVSYYTYLIVALLVSIFFFFLWGYGYRFFEIDSNEIGTARRLFLMTGVWSVCAWPMQVYGQILRGLQEFRIDNLTLISQALVSNVGYVLVALMDWPIEAAFLAFMLSQAVMFFQGSRAVRRILPQLQISPKHATIRKFREITGFSLWMMAMQLSGMVIGQTDQTLLAIFVSSAAVTAYTIAATPMNTIRNLNMMVMGAVMPSVSEAYGSRDHGYIERLALRGTRVNAIVMVGLLTAGAAAAYPGLYLWMGPGHAQNAPIARMLMIAYAWSAAFTIVGQTLVGMGHVRQLGWLSLASAVLNLGVSLALVKPLGMTGVVLGTIIAYVAIAPFQVRLFTRSLNLSIRRFLWETLAPVYALCGVLGTAFWLLSRLLGDEPNLIAAAAFVCITGVSIPGIAALLLLPREDSLMFRRRLAQALPSWLGRRISPANPN
ncbi:oligosaccharide flippase family protein [bacterium]|nr:oligosaccharide flippase family protein [bacterium]